MSYNAEQQRAIKWYEGQHGLKVQMSAYPIVHFLGADGREEKVNILNVVGDYHSHHKSPAKRGGA